MNTWQLFAFASAFFAALTAIFGKIGVADINSDLATWIRTIVILTVLSAIVT
jgi:transporter family protein